MGDFGFNDSAIYRTIGTVASATGGTAISVVPPINTKGSFAQLTLGEAVHASSLLVQLGNPTDGGTTSLLDVAIGPQDAETVLIANLALQRGGVPMGVHYPFPLALRPQTRIAVRGQAQTGSQTVSALLGLSVPGFAVPPELGLVRTYGANTATSRGTSVDCGGTANVKGAWTQLTASTTAPGQYLLLFFGTGGSTYTTAHYLFDVGIGAAGAETVLIPNLVTGVGGAFSLDMYPSVCGPLPVEIPVGSRLAVRGQCSGTAQRTVDVLAYVVG